MTAHDLPTLLRAARHARAMTQGDLAERLGVTQSAISQWESGQNTPPIVHRTRLAALFAIPIRDLYPEIPDKQWTSELERRFQLRIFVERYLTLSSDDRALMCQLVERLARH